MSILKRKLSGARSFRPSDTNIGQPRRGIAATLHTPQSQLSTKFSKPGFGFGVKDVLTSTPEQRKQYVQEYRQYQQQLKKQKEYAQELKNLQGATQQTEQAYRKLRGVEQRKLKSIDELRKAQEDVAKYTQELQQTISQVKQQQAQQKSRSSSRGSSRRIYTPQGSSLFVSSVNIPSSSKMSRRPTSRYTIGSRSLFSRFK
jgi:vacuolar-type H+-ATPase subunit I/STV1